MIFLIYLLIFNILAFTSFLNPIDLKPDSIAWSPFDILFYLGGFKIYVHFGALLWATNASYIGFIFLGAEKSRKCYWHEMLYVLKGILNPIEIELPTQLSKIFQNLPKSH